MRGLRVLVIDNSISFQEVLAKELLHRLPAGSLVERASDPIDAQEKMIPFHPAIIVMNFAMGSITVDGSKFLTRLTMGHQGRPGIPVIVYGLMSANRKLALLRGAAAYLKKPGTEASSPLFYDQLVDHIQQIVATQNVNNAGVGPGAMVTKEIWTATLPKDKFPQPLSPADRVIHQAETEKNEYQPSTQHSSDKETYQPADISASDAPIELIAIGSSTGGTEALSTILTRLRPPLPGIVIVQHIPPMFSRLLSERLDNECALTVKEAATGDIVQPDHVYIAPGSKHMTLKRYGSQLILHCNPGPPVHSVCPSVDVLFDSVAHEVGRNACGVLLTGMGKDGAEGLLHMRQQGAHTIGQDEATSTVYGMPKAAFEQGAVETQLPLSAIPAAITNIARKKP